MSDIIQGLKGKPRNRKVLDFIDKWPLKVERNKLFHNGKQVIAYEDTEKILKREAEQNGMPLSRDGAFEYLKRKYVGFKKRRIGTWLKRIEQLQLLHRRPHFEHRVYKQDREGTKNYLMRDNKLNLGVDLFDIPRQWSSYRYFFVAVLQRSGYTWCFPLKSKKAVATLTQLKKVFRDCKKKFGVITGVSSDNGTEFKGAFDEWLKTKKIKRKVLTGRLTMTWWVEKKNSTFARLFAVMLEIHGFKKALELSLEKVNNIRSRVTRKTPADWEPVDFTKSTKRFNRKMPEKVKRRKQPVYKVGTRVRYLLKAAQGKSKFYKSYEGMRSSKHAMWSKRIFLVKTVKKLGHRLMYKVNDIYRYSHELQLIEGDVLLLEAPRPPAAKPHRKKIQKPKPKSQVLLSPQPLRRSTRVRNKPKRWGFS